MMQVEPSTQARGAVFIFSVDQAVRNARDGRRD